MSYEKYHRYVQYQLNLKTTGPWANLFPSDIDNDIGSYIGT